MLSIDDYFTDEILGKVLRYCPAESYETLRAVSQRWDQIVDRYVGRVLIVKSDNALMVDPESNLDRMSIRTNYWMTLSSEQRLTEIYSSKKEKDTVTENSEKGSGDDAIVEEVEKLQDIRNPESVRKIGFVGQLGLIGYKPVECILSPCKNITSLFLHLSLFCVPKYDTIQKNNEPWQVSCCLPHLKELVIDSCGISSEDSTTLFCYKATFLAVSSFLCSQQFVCLEKLVLAIPYMESTEGILIRSLCIFLGRHTDSMKRFFYTQKYEIVDDRDSESSSDEENCHQVNASGSHHQGAGDGDRSSWDKGRKTFNFSHNVNYLSLRQLALSVKELKNVSLEEFHVVLTKRQESSPVWKNLLIKQGHIEKCILVGDRIPLPVGAIKTNASALVTLRLDVRDLVNLECFRHCVNLKHLALGGQNDADESCGAEDGDETDLWNGNQMYQQPVQLQNASCLPFGLESLEIINLRTHKDDARIMALVLPSLRDLTLKNLGWEGNLGLMLSDLAQIYRLGKLNHLCIKASLNMLSYSELEDRRSSPELNLFACVVQSNSFTAASNFFLEVWKREDGLYSTRKLSNTYIEEAELDVFQVSSKVELREEEEPNDCSSSDIDEEDVTEETEEAEEEDETEKEVVSDEDWQECEDEENEENEDKEE